MTYAAAFLLGNCRASAFVVEPCSDKLGTFPRA